MCKQTSDNGKYLKNSYLVLFPPKRLGAQDTSEVITLKEKYDSLKQHIKDIEYNHIKSITELKYIASSSKNLLSEALLEIQHLKSHQANLVSSTKTTLHKIDLQNSIPQTARTACITNNEIISAFSSHTKNHGIQFINAKNFKTSTLHLIHTETIRSICTSLNNDLLLTGSLDKSVRLVCLNTRSILCTFPTEDKVWSVAFDLNQSSILYAGLYNNTVLEFNLSDPTNPIKHSISLKTPAKGIHSLISIEQGVLCANTGGVYLIAKENPREIEIQAGNCLSISFDHISKYILSTWRIENKTRLKIILSKFIDNFTQISSIEIDYSHSTLSRSCIWSYNDACFVAVADESVACIKIFKSEEEGELKHHRDLQVEGAGKVYDIFHKIVDGVQYVGAVRDGRLAVFTLS